MKLEQTKMKLDESKGNHYVVPAIYEDCPINMACTFFRGNIIVAPCKYLQHDEKELNCLYPKGGDFN